jgi:hypothetical protein
MHAGGTIMGGGAPHAMIDADRRRDITPGDTELAEALRRLKVLHGNLTLIVV